MHRSTVAVALGLSLAPSLAQSQALSLTSAMASGDCSGTSFHQSADASGKFLAAEWAVASQFPVPVNRGRVRCSIRYNVTIPAGYRIVVGAGPSLPLRLALAQLSPLRLNGTTSRVLVESAIGVDGPATMTASGTSSGGPMTMAMLSQDRAATSAAPESVCATATKTTFFINAVVDAAEASSYVVPWPPEPYADREVAAMGSVRLFYTLVSCAPTRTAVPQADAIRPPA